MTENTEELPILRPARPDEAGPLAELHYRAYTNRFFDETATDQNGKPYGAPLAKEFPQLALGQNAAYFREYWNGFVRELDAPDPRRRNYCLVAATPAEKILGFVKGYGGSLDEGMSVIFNRAVASDARPVNGNICELGSLYLDPGQKFRGTGRKLVSAFGKAMLGLGHEAMVTRAYDKNDSPDFFVKAGARLMGKCSILTDYLGKSGRMETAAIPGLWLYWDRESLRKLAPSP